MDTSTTTTDTTPASPSPETSAAAPATSAPSPTASASQRPTSFADAFERIAASPSSPAADTPEPAATAPTQPAETTGATTNPSTETKPGEPPKEKWPTILDNARTKAAADAIAKYREQHGWAETINREHAEAGLAMFQKWTSDPLAHIREAIAAVRSHPVYGPQLKSEAARTLAGRSEAKPPEPDVAITDAQGNVVGRTYSDAALAKRDEWLIGRVTQQLRGEIEPLKTREQARDAEAAAALSRQQAETTADAMLKEAATWEGYTDHLKDIAEAMDAHPDWTLHQAYVDVLHRVILPARNAQAESKVLDALKQKAAGNTASPTGTAAPITRPKTRAELAAWLAARA